MKEPARGQDLVEFALVFPLFILIVVAIFDFGRGLMAYNSLRNGTREGARYAAVHLNDTAGVDNAILTRVMALDTDPANLAIPYKAWCFANDDYDDAEVKVCATYQYQPVLTGIFGSTINLRSFSTMRMEQFPADFPNQIIVPSCPAVPLVCN